jgi:serine/threonine-protein kinase
LLSAEHMTTYAAPAATDPSTSRERTPRRRLPDAIPAPRAVAGDEFRGSSRYELLVKIASGGSAAVYIGRVTGSAGFSRLVAVKRAHAHLAHDPAVERMMRTEARLASGLNHANVVAVQDVEHIGSELLLILDYVEGASLAELLEQGALSGCELPGRVAVRIALDACAGLAAVHEIEGKDGRPVGFLHRDVSPQNILVGVDGTARITDFGLAKHICSDNSKASGTLQGKLAYLAPEVIDNAAFSVQSDLFAMGVVVWEALAKRRLFQGDSWADTVRKVGLVEPPPLSRVVPALGKRLDAIVARALDKAPVRRHATVREFAAQLEETAVAQDLVATSSEVSRYVQSVVGEALRRRRELIRSFQGADALDDLLTTQTASILPPLATALRQELPVAGGAAITRASARHEPPAAAAQIADERTTARMPAHCPEPAGASATWPPRYDATPTSLELSSGEYEIAEDEDDLEACTTISRHERAPALRARPAPVPPEVAPPSSTLLSTIAEGRATPLPLPAPAHVSGALLRRQPRIEVREMAHAGPADRPLPRIHPPDDEESQDTTGASGDMSPSAWVGDPLSPWVPPTTPPPARPGQGFRRAAVALAALAAGAGAALIAAFTVAPETFSPASAREGAPAIAAPGPAAQTPAKLEAAPARPEAAKPEAAPARPEAAATAKAKPLTPDALPDARAAAPAPKRGALTPDALPDAQPSAPRGAAPRARAPEPPEAPPAGHRKARPNPYR